MFRSTRFLACDSKMAAVHPQPLQDALPPGWECRFDPRTGQYYFLNHHEHITTWEDPRLQQTDAQQAYTPYYSGSHPSNATPPPPPPPPIAPMPQPLASHVTNGSAGGRSSPARFFVQGGYSPHYGSPRTPYRFKDSNVQVDERILMKLCVQFPTVEEGYMWQLLKQYHNRENVVVSALLAEGQPRAQTHSVDLTPKLQRAEHHVIFTIDEALYFKLRNFFPTADPDAIRHLQKIYNNQEHEVIAALVAGNRANRFPSPHPSSPKMKLRYLKLVFPEADEAMLFDVLNNCDNNAQEASSRLVNMGYKKRDTPVTRPLVSQPFQKPVTEIPRPILSPPERPIIVIPPSASDKIQLVSRLQDQFPAVSRTLVNMALDSSNYNEDRAKQFLSAMTPQDSIRPAVPQIEGESTLVVPSDTIPAVPPRSRHASQDSDTTSRHSSLERHSVRGDSSREATPSKSPSHRISVSSPARSTSSPSRKIASAPAAAPERTFRQKFKREVLKCLFRFSKGTSTQDESETVSKYRSKAKGADPSLRKGPCDKLLLKNYLPWFGPNRKNHKGPDSSLRHGPDPNNLSSKKESRSKGPQALCRGALSSLTHASSSITNNSVDTINTRSS